MIEIAYFSLILGLFCAVYTLGASIVGITSKARAKWFKSAENGIWAIAGLFSFAVLMLLYFLLQRNFQVEYVASYTDIHLALPYVVSALWAGQQGSLLFWGWILAICSVVFLQQRQALTDSERPYVYGALALTLGFFLILLIFVANPFATLDFRPADGQGMNPLLQNFYMAIHPPVLFIGYAGFLIPFVLSLATLCTGVVSDAWLKYARGWTLFSWYFLGIGIILGAHWAYLELGWGGYWSWDPVENASFIPWLTSTALIHTLIVQKRRGMMRLWNLFLSILTFLLCIVATFITRSGMIDSVHAFGESVIGFYFLAFLGLIAVVTIALIIVHWNALRSTYEVPSLLSKDGSFIFINQLFMGLGFAVLYGTMYSFFSELAGGRKVTIDASFFNRISIPVGLVILGLIAVCQLLAWKSVSFGVLRKKFMRPAIGTAVAIVVLWVVGIHNGLALITCAFSIFILISVCLEIGSTLIHRTKTWKQPFGKVLLTTITAQKPRYVGFLVHAGTALLYIGIAISSTYKLEQEVRMVPGQSVSLGGYEFVYQGLSVTEDPQKATVAADVVLSKGGKTIATIVPEKRFYGEGQRQQVTTEVGLRTSLLRDIYVILAGWEDDQTATISFIIYPLIMWIWIGGFFVYTLGIIITILPRPRKFPTDIEE